MPGKGNQARVTKQKLLAAEEGFRRILEQRKALAPPLKRKKVLPLCRRKKDPGVKEKERNQ